jgi:2-polyprenyl-3-methyl-5-hydroxy-6-metoxy-1,4-benzoquinol methylase
MRKKTPVGELPSGEGKAILRQIREEMQRSYQPREGNQSTEPADAGQRFSVELMELRSAIAALSTSYALVGQTPPEPPTFRGRMGAQLVKVVQRLLFWYTPQIVHFQYSALSALECALRAFEGQAKNVEQLENEFRRDAAATASRTDLLERRLEALQIEELPRMDRAITRLRAQQTVQEERLALAIEARHELPQPSGPAAAQRLAQEELPNTDAFYAALADEFRGSRQEIKQRLSVYLPKLAAAGIGSESLPILDVGCGRGEWLELLREHQLHAVGIDLNRVVLAMCQERGLPVERAEAVEHLRSLPEASLGAVTAFHLIEHLALPQLLDLLDAARRALKPGGVAIFETPNPNNILVSSRNFYLDPSHRHPIPTMLGRFLAAAQGFERVEILELHPWPVEQRVDTSRAGDVAARFNECFYGPQDYAVIGWKV